MDIIFGLLITGVILRLIWRFIPSTWHEYNEELDNDVDEDYYSIDK